MDQEPGEFLLLAAKSKDVRWARSGAGGNKTTKREAMSFEVGNERLEINSSAAEEVNAFVLPPGPNTNCVPELLLMSGNYG